MTWYSTVLRAAAVGAAVFLFAQPLQADPRDDRDRDRWEDRWEDRDRDRWEDRRARDHDRGERRHDRRDRDDRFRDRHRGHRDRGPDFCRSGAGHPRHGMRWCFEKGFAPRHSRWLAYDPGHVVFGRRWVGRHLRRHALDDVLGGGVVRRLLHHRGAIGVGGELVGEWQRPRELYPARVLEVRVGNLPIAEFIDVNDDGRVDVAYLLDPWG